MCTIFVHMCNFLCNEFKHSLLFVNFIQLFLKSCFFIVSLPPNFFESIHWLLFVLQVPECGEGADHRERVKHFVYDYAYTTKSGPIPKLQESAALSDINGNNASVRSRDQASSVVPPLSFDINEPVCTPLYSTASSPYILYPKQFGLRPSNFSRSYCSLPSFPPERLPLGNDYSSLGNEEDNGFDAEQNLYRWSGGIAMDVGSPRAGKSDLKNNYRAKYPYPRHALHRGGMLDRSHQQRRRRNHVYEDVLDRKTSLRCAIALDSGPQSLPLVLSENLSRFQPLSLTLNKTKDSTSNLISDLRSKTSNTLLGIPRNASNSSSLSQTSCPATTQVGAPPASFPLVPPNTPNGAPTVHRTRPSRTTKSPYPRRCRSRTTTTTTTSQPDASAIEDATQHPCDDWVLPQSPEEAHWLAASQHEVSSQRLPLYSTFIGPLNSP